MGYSTIRTAFTVGPDGNLWCVDNGDHTVRQMSPDGKVLMTIGTPGQPSPPMSGKPFNAPSHVAFDPRNGDFYVRRRLYECRGA